MISEREIDLYEEYLIEPDKYVLEVLGADAVEEYQSNILEDIADYDRIAIRATHSVGKTWLMARAALWFFNMFPNSIVITTAPTYRQVKALLWGEIRSAHRKAKIKIGGRLLDTELKHSDKHYMMGFSPQVKAGSGSSEQQSSSFQGFHSDYVLVIFDEATGVTPDVWTMADGLLTSGKMVKFVAIGNPTTRNCKFFECFSDPSWKKIKISCFDSPNMIANGLVNIEALENEIDRLKALSESERVNEIQKYQKPVPYLLTAQFVVPYVMRLGFDHPLVLSKVLGEFPKEEDNVFVQFDDVVQASERNLELDLAEKRYIGVDVARFGEDKTVITVLNGYKQTLLKPLVKRDIVAVTGELINIIMSSVIDTVVCIDATGLGAGVHDLLVEKKRAKILGKNVQIVEVHNGASPDIDGENKEEIELAKSRYANLKARQWDLLSEDVKMHLDLFDESNYLEELPKIKFSFDSKGRYVVESKDDYKKRTGLSSPDYADSLALANFARYVSVEHGRFNQRELAKPIIKQEKRKPRKSGIKIREY